MVRGLAPRSLALSDLRKLKKKVNKNTKKLHSMEIGRLRITMDPTPDTTAIVQDLTGITQGDDVAFRHGRKVHAISLSVSGSVIKNTASAVTRMRFFLVRDNLGTTTPPVLTDLFSDQDDFFNNQHRLINEQPMKRFTVLWDKYIVLRENFDGETSAIGFRFKKKLNFDVLFTGAAATDEGKNHIYFVSGSDEATNVPAVTGDIVLRYSDL